MEHDAAFLIFPVKGMLLYILLGFHGVDQVFYKLSYWNKTGCSWCSLRHTEDLGAYLAII